MKGSYDIVDTSGWRSLSPEPLGSKPGKLWLVDDHGIDWLFKPVISKDGKVYGDDWAERIATQVATLLDIPSARVELALRDGTPGIISQSVVWITRDGGERAELSLGNEVLGGLDPDYPMEKRHAVPAYTVDRVLGALETLRIAAPEHAPLGFTAADAFAGYLVLDALIANTDRHHENWGVLRPIAGDRTPSLAPSFDHASSLGFQLSDQDRMERLTTRDAGRDVRHYAGRGRSRHMPGRPLLVDVALEALRWKGRSPDVWADRLRQVTNEDLVEATESVPESRMSHPARTFAAELLMENKRRLLDVCDNAG